MVAQMMVPVWIFLVPLVVLAGFAAVVGLGVYAVVKNRPGIVAGIGGLMLVLVAGGLLFALVGVGSVARVPESRLQAGPVSMTFDGGSNSHEMSSSVRVSWRGMLFVLALPLVLLFALVRWMTSNKGGRECGKSAWVPVVLALALLGFVGLGGAKWHYARHYSNVEGGRRNAEVARQIAEVQADVARQQAQVARQAVQTQAEIDIQQRIAQADIHALMDEVDAPQIPLQPTPPEPPETSELSVEKTATIEPAVATVTTEGESKNDEAELATEARAAIAKIIEYVNVASEATIAAAKKAEAHVDTLEALQNAKPTGEVASAAENSADDSKHSVAADNDSKSSANSNSNKVEVAVTASTTTPAASTASVILATEAAPTATEPPAEGVAPVRELDPQPEPKSTPESVATGPRPDWIDDPPKRVGDRVREVIVTDEYASVDECTRATDIYLLFKTYERMHELVGHPSYETALPSVTFSDGCVWAGDGRQILYTDTKGKMVWDWSNEQIGFLHRLGIGVDYVRREIVAKDGSKSEESRQYFETVERTFGPMKKLYTQIEFTPAVDRELRQRWESHQRLERFQVVGLGAGGVLGLLGMVFGLLKVDTWTKGYYTKRLFLGVPAAIIGLVSLLALFS